MCDVINMQLTLEPNQTTTVPLDILTENTMVAYEVSSFMAHTPVSVYPSDQVFDTPLQYLNFSVTVTKVGGKYRTRCRKYSHMNNLNLTFVCTLKYWL